MSGEDEQPDQKNMARVIRAQRRRIAELESQVDYLTKRFRAAKQAVKWFEARFKWRWEDSYGT